MIILDLSSWWDKPFGSGFELFVLSFLTKMSQFFVERTIIALQESQKTMEANQPSRILPPAAIASRISGMKSDSLVTVIIPTHNSERTILTCLNSIRSQTYKNIELVVVDSFSSDRTREIVSSFGAKLLLHSGERTEKKNVGATTAQGEYLLFCDSDFELESSVVEECMESRSRADAAIVPVISAPIASFWVKCRRLERQIYNEGDMMVEAARFFRADVFHKLRGFDRDLITGEDFDLTFRARREGFRISKIHGRVRHPDPASIREIISSYYYYGKFVPRLLQKHRGVAVGYMAPIRPTFLRYHSIVRKDPVHFIGLLLMRLIAYLSGFFGIGRSTLFPDRDKRIET